MFSLCSNMQPSLYNSTQTYIYIFEHWLNGGCLYSPYATIVDATRRVNALHSRPFNGMHPKHTRHDKILSAYSHTKSNREEYNAMQQNAARHRNSVLRKKTEAGKSFDVFFRSQSPPVVAHENDIWAHRTPATVKHLVVRATCTKHPTCIQHTVA